MPADSESWLPTEQVVALYRQHRQMSTASGTGKVAPACAVWPCAWLMGFTLAYLLTLLLSQNAEAEYWRACLECP
jgi:hypothetical protein